MKEVSYVRMFEERDDTSRCVENVEVQEQWCDTDGNGADKKEK